MLTPHRKQSVADNGSLVAKPTLRADAPTRNARQYASYNTEDSVTSRRGEGVLKEVKSQCTDRVLRGFRASALVIVFALLVSCAPIAGGYVAAQLRMAGRQASQSSTLQCQWCAQQPGPHAGAVAHVALPLGHPHGPALVS